MADVREMTAAAAGLSSDRQIEIALKAIVDWGGVATSAQIYEEIERHMPLGVRLSQQGRDSLRHFIGSDAVRRGYVESHDPERPGWFITASGREFLSLVENTSGIEKEDTLSDESDAPITISDEELITRPFDPSTIRVEPRMMTIFQVMRKVELNEVQLQPDFQRNFVWNRTRQSRLIESILLRIPLPAFYLDSTREDTWSVVDGLQRLSTLDRFYNQNSLALTNLEFLSGLNGKHFKDLPRNFQRTIEETQLNLYIIRPETLPQVKFTIFSRVNTGGLVLTPQEIRHALFQGRATSLLAELAVLQEFLEATTYSISPLRMDDRECVLRFLAFHLTGYKQYGQSESRDKSGRALPEGLDSFLSQTMEQLNTEGEVRLALLSEAFRQAMIRAREVFHEYAFRKMYQRKGRRTQISKPLFEAWSVLLLPYDLDALSRSRDAIIEGFIELMSDIDFNKAISLGTGSIRSVHTRFGAIERLLEETVR